MNKFARNRKGFFVVTIFIVSVIAGYEWMFDGDTETASQQIPQAVKAGEKQSSGLSPASENSLVDNTIRGVGGSSRDAASSGGEVAAGAPVWLISYDAQPSISIPDGVVEYEPISIDMSSPAFPSPGQRVALGLTNGDMVGAIVATSNENPNGDYSWRGYLDGYGTKYPVIMTYGANSVFATITTPKGSYTLESIDGSGWIYKNPSEFELSEPGKNDYQEIPDTHIH